MQRRVIVVVVITTCVDDVIGYCVQTWCSSVIGGGRSHWTPDFNNHAPDTVSVHNIQTPQRSVALPKIAYSVLKEQRRRKFYFRA